MTAPKTPKTTRQRGSEHKRRIYIKQPLWEALERICMERGESVSGALTNRAKAYIRQHAPLLRKHNFPVPEEAFQK